MAVQRLASAGPSMRYILTQQSQPSFCETNARESRHFASHASNAAISAGSSTDTQMVARFVAKTALGISGSIGSSYPPANRGAYITACQMARQTMRHRVVLLLWLLLVAVLHWTSRVLLAYSPDTPKRTLRQPSQAALALLVRQRQVPRPTHRRTFAGRSFLRVYPPPS